MFKRGGSDPTPEPSSSGAALSAITPASPEAARAGGASPGETSPPSFESEPVSLDAALALPSGPGRRKTVVAAVRALAARDPERVAAMRAALARYQESLVSRGRGAEIPELDAEEREKLRALGYID